MRPPRWLLFGLAMSSLVLLTYAGVLLAFSVEVTPEMAAANPSMPAGHRAIVVPVSAPGTVLTAAQNATSPTLLMRGETNGTLPHSATATRVGEALLYVPANAEGEAEVANVTLDLAVISGGAEGWIVKGEAESEPWYAPREGTIGAIARVEPPARLGALFLMGGVGFIAPLVLVVLTHRATRGERKGAPLAICRECRAPMSAGNEFCMRCGAWTKKEAEA